MNYNIIIFPVFVIFICTLLTFFVYASTCIVSTDWPERPCYAETNVSSDQMKKDWSQYYNMKGKDWMETKKDEMHFANDNKILKEWYEYGFRDNSYVNQNVWMYYNLYNEAPDIQPYYDNTVKRNDFSIIITYYYVSFGSILIICISILFLTVFFIQFIKNHRISKKIKS